MPEVSQTKKIQVRRKEKKSYLPAKVKNNAKRVIGSVFKDRQPLGLEDRELEEKLLQEYEGLRPEDRDYSEKRHEFWKEMRVIVPSEGKVLDISIDQSGKPRKIEDYLIFKWLENHPMVGMDKQQMINNPNMEYYIYDPEEELRHQNKQAQSRKQAYKKLLEIQEDEVVVDQLIRLLTDQNPARLSNLMKENRLEQVANTQPKRFLRYAEDKNLAIRAEIEEMVEYGVLRKSGNQYIYMDEVIGEDIQDAIIYFKNERNSSTVLDLRAKLKESRNIG